MDKNRSDFHFETKKNQNRFDDARVMKLKKQCCTKNVPLNQNKHQPSLRVDRTLHTEGMCVFDADRLQG